MNAKTARRLSKRKSKGVSLNGGGMTMSIIELMHQIVREPAPRLTPEGRFPKEAEEFVDACLLKDPDERQTPKMLLVSLLISQSIGNPAHLILFADIRVDGYGSGLYFRSESMDQHFLTCPVVYLLSA